MGDRAGACACPATPLYFDQKQKDARTDDDRTTTLSLSLSLSLSAFVFLCKDDVNDDDEDKRRVFSMATDFPLNQINPLFFP